MIRVGFCCWCRCSNKNHSLRVLKLVDWKLFPFRVQRHVKNLICFTNVMHVAWETIKSSLLIAPSMFCSHSCRPSARAMQRNIRRMECQSNADGGEHEKKKREREIFSPYKSTTAQRQMRTISRFVSFQLRFYIPFWCFAAVYKTKALPHSTHPHTHTHIHSDGATHNRWNTIHVLVTCIGPFDSMRPRHFNLRALSLEQWCLPLPTCIWWHFYERKCECKRSIRPSIRFSQSAPPHAPIVNVIY